MTETSPPSDHTAKLRQVAQASAVVGLVFTLAFLALMIANGYRQYVVGTQEETHLTALKQQLLQEPDNASLLEEVRQRDLAVRSSKLRQLDFTGLAALMLLVSAAVTVAAFKWLGHLQGIAPEPSEDTQEPFRRRRLAASRMALVASASLLAAVSLFMTQRVSSGWLTSAVSVAPNYALPQALAQNWHRFRGFAGAGVSSHNDIPTRWDGATGKGIRWKTRIPLSGYNSPVVWDNRIFLSGATDKERTVYCIDAASGDILWTGDVPTAPMAGGKKLDVMEDTGLAACTMATDGVRAYAIFATGDLAAFDYNGRLLWHKNLGVPDNVYGHASSLEVWQDRVLVQYDQAYAGDGKSRLYALDGATGRVVWETKRPVSGSWTSPIVGPVGKAYQLIAVADPWVMAYDPDDGKEIWRAEHVGGEAAASPILMGDLVIAVEPNAQSVAIRPGGTGNVTETHLAWRNEDAGPDISSPVTDGQRLYLVDTYGTLYVVNAGSGKLLYEHEFERTIKPSPSLVAGKLYVLAENGAMFIGTADNAGYTLETTSLLGERCLASPAFMAGRIYIRGTRHLYCIAHEQP